MLPLRLSQALFRHHFCFVFIQKIKSFIGIAGADQHCPHNSISLQPAVNVSIRNQKAKQKRLWIVSLGSKWLPAVSALESLSHLPKNCTVCCRSMLAGCAGAQILQGLKDPPPGQIDAPAREILRTGRKGKGLMSSRKLMKVTTFNLGDNSHSIFLQLALSPFVKYKVLFYYKNVQFSV